MKISKTTLAVALAALTIGGFASTAAAAEASIGLDFASAYVFRGATLNDGWVAQPSVEVGGEGLAGFTLGVWGNLDLESSDTYPVESGQFSEIDIYAAYEVPMNVEDTSLSLGYVEYTYPGSDVDADREINIITEFDVVSAPYLALFYGVDGAIQDQFYAEAGVSHAWDVAEDTSVGIGGLLSYISQGDVAKAAGAASGLNHALLTADVTWKVLSASINYVVETDEDVLLVDEDLYFIVGAGYDF